MPPKFKKTKLKMSFFVKINNNYAVPAQLNQYPLLTHEKYIYIDTHTHIYIYVYCICLVRTPTIISLFVH